MFSLAIILKKLQEHDYENSQEKNDWLEELKKINEIPYQSIIWMLVDDDKNYRDFAYGFFSRIRKDKELLSILMQEMQQKKEDREIQKISLAIANLNPHGLEEMLKMKVSRGAPQEKIVGLTILQNVGSVQPYIELYKTTLKDPNDKVRYMTVKILSRYIQKEEIFSVLCPILLDKDEKIRRLIVSQLSKSKDIKVIGIVFELMTKATPDNQKLLILALKEIAEKMNVNLEELIIPALQDANKKIREAGAKFLVKLPNLKTAVQHLFDTLETKSLDAKKTVFSSFLYVGEEIKDTIIDLLKEGNINYRINAMLIAGNLKDSRAIPHIGNLLKEKMDWWLKIVAAKILGSYSAHEVIHVLEKYEEDIVLQREIIDIYGKLKCNSKLPFLEKHLHSKSIGIRRNALKSIIEIGTPESVEIMKSIANENCDWYLYNELKLLNEKEQLPFSIPDIKKQSADTNYHEKVSFKMIDDFSTEEESSEIPSLASLGISGKPRTTKSYRVASTINKPTLKHENIGNQNSQPLAPVNEFYPQENLNRASTPIVHNNAFIEEPQNNQESNNPDYFNEKKQNNEQINQISTVEEKQNTRSIDNAIPSIKEQNNNSDEQSITFFGIDQKPKKEHEDTITLPYGQIQSDDDEVGEGVDLTLDTEEPSFPQEQPNTTPEPVISPSSNEQHNKIDEPPAERSKDEILNAFRSRFQRITKKHALPESIQKENEKAAKEANIHMEVCESPKNNEPDHKSHVPNIFQSAKKDRISFKGKLPFKVNPKTNIKLNIKKKEEE